MIAHLKHVTVVGASAPQDFQLLNDGAPFDGVGLSVTIEFRPSLDADGEAVDYSGLAVDWLDRDVSTVRVTGADTLPRGEHRFRFKLEGGGADDYAPNGVESSTWIVTRV